MAIANKSIYGRKIFFLFLVFFSAFNSFAQKDSLQNQILNYSDADAEIISKGRGLLADKFLEGDYKKVREIKDYLLHKVQDKDYVVFYPVEYWYILHWTQQYNDLLASIKALDSLKGKDRRSINPPADLLYSKLHDKSRDSIFQLQAFINNSDLEAIDKDFLLMHLKYITSQNDQQARDTLNTLADQFLASHPNSGYDNFTRKYIRYKFIPSKWGYVFEFFSGYGIFTKELKKDYTNAIPIGIAFDIYYKRVALYLRDYIGFSKTRIDLPYSNGVWKKGSQVRVYLPEASLGYVVLDNKILKLAPFAGIASADLAPTQNDLNKIADLENAELKFTTTYTAGLNLDIKLGPSKTPMISFEQEQSYWFLRLRYAYNSPQFEKKYNGVNGSMHYITVGIGGFGRRIKRDY